MAKSKEVGLEHIMKLGIRVARDPKGIYTELSRKFGQNRASEILDSIQQATEKGKQIPYDVKNEDYEVAMVFSGSYDADIVRKACNWVSEHQNEFGDEILEIGCDCGFMTTFLGSLFPEKHITAIDRSQAGIEVARENVKRFGIENIDFICVDAMDFTDKTFDTVFSMRTMQENGSCDGIEDPSRELIDQADVFIEEKQAYANKLNALLKDNGKLVSIERIHQDAMFLAWIQVLTNAGLKVDLESYTELKCLEVGDESYFQSLVFTKEDCSEVDVFMSFMNCFAKHIDTSLPQYNGWDAKVMYEYTGGKLIEGVEIRNTISNTINRVVCRAHKYDDTCIVWYQNNDGDAHVEYHDVSQKDNAIEEINKIVEQANELGYFEIKRIED